MRKLLVILGVPIDDLDVDETLDRLERFVYTGRQTGKAHQVATINTDFVVKSLQDPELRYLLQEVDLATADGMPLVWGARLLDVPLRARVAGADVIPMLAERAAQRGYSLYLLGAAPGVAQRAADVLQARHPQLRIVGVCSPPYTSVLEMDESILSDIRRADPDILLVAFGNPKQEKWIGMYKHELKVPVMMGVGGTLDFIAGETRRAPLWMQNLGLEWLHRLLQEPQRLWKRYAVDLGVFGYFFLRQWWVMRRSRQPLVLPRTDVVVVDETAVLHIQGRLDVRTTPDFTAKAEAAIAETSFVIVELSAATFLDSTGIGALVGLAKQLRDLDGKLWLVAIPPPILQTLQIMRLDRFFEVLPSVEAGLEAHRTRQQQRSLPVVVRDGWAVVGMPRRLDAVTAPEVCEVCLQVLARHARIVLDFSETAFLASAGLSTIATLHREALARQGEVRLSNCSPDVAQVLRTVRFDQFVPLYTDVLQATA